MIEYTDWFVTPVVLGAIYTDLEARSDFQVLGGDG
jgi:hypothetical protein